MERDEILNSYAKCERENVKWISNDGSPTEKFFEVGFFGADNKSLFIGAQRGVMVPTRVRHYYNTAVLFL